MQIKFAKIPKGALILYVLGFVIMGVCFWLFVNKNAFLSTLRLQQLFILGALVVAMGSLINIFHQFKKK